MKALAVNYITAEDSIITSVCKAQARFRGKWVRVKSSLLGSDLSNRYRSATGCDTIPEGDLQASPRFGQPLRSTRRDRRHYLQTSLLTSRWIRRNVWHVDQLYCSLSPLPFHACPYSLIIFQGPVNTIYNWSMQNVNGQDWSSLGHSSSVTDCTLLFVG